MPMLQCSNTLPAWTISRAAQAAIHHNDLTQAGLAVANPGKLAVLGDPEGVRHPRVRALLDKSPRAKAVLDGCGDPVNRS